MPCLNWQVSDAEVVHRIRLTEPSLIMVSERYDAQVQRIGHGTPCVVFIGREYETLLANAPETEPAEKVEPEDGLVILYTSGTPGLTKGGLISHRAKIARAIPFTSDYGISRNDNCLAWSPLFHRAATDFSLATLILGGKVLVQDGLQVDRLIAVLERERIGWLVAMPGMIETFITALKQRKAQIKLVRFVGAMADLMPLQQTAEMTASLDAPYFNSVGSTETALPPASAVPLPIGQVPADLFKRESGFCRIRLVDAEARDVPDRTPLGELLIRGPTLFSCYWGTDEANAADFRGGWLWLGDMFIRRPGGTLDFVDRVTCLIMLGAKTSIRQRPSMRSSRTSMCWMPSRCVSATKMERGPFRSRCTAPPGSLAHGTIQVMPRTSGKLQATQGYPVRDPNRFPTQCRQNPAA